MLKVNKLYRAIKGRGKQDLAYRKNDNVKYIKINSVYGQNLNYDLYAGDRKTVLFANRSFFKASDIDESSMRLRVLNRDNRQPEVPVMTRTFVLFKSLPKENKMTNLSILAQKLLSPDIRILVKAGVLTKSLDVADPNFVVNFLAAKYQKELAAEAKKMLKKSKVDVSEDEE